MRNLPVETFHAVLERVSHHADCRAANQWHPEYWDDPTKCNCDEATQLEFARWKWEQEIRVRDVDHKSRRLSPEKILIF